MSKKKDDLLDRMIVRLEKKRAAVNPRGKRDIDTADSTAQETAQAKLAKRGGFPVEGTQTTENEQQARERARLRRQQLRQQRADAEAARRSLIAARVDVDTSETEEEEYKQEEDDES